MAKEDEDYLKKSQAIRSIKFFIEREIPSTQEILCNAIKKSYPDQYGEALALVKGEAE